MAEDAVLALEDTKIMFAHIRPDSSAATTTLTSSKPKASTRRCRRNLSRLDQPVVWIGVNLGRKMSRGRSGGGRSGAVTEVEPRRFLCAAETACRVD